MSDVGPLATQVGEDDAAHTAQAGRPGMFADPVVRMMAVAAIGLVILFLATVLGALLTDVGKAESPRTAAEMELLIAGESVKAGAVGDAWVPYINALVSTGDLGTARVTLDRARASAPGTDTPGLELAEGRIELAQERYPQAIRAADKAMKIYVARQKARVAANEASKTAGSPLELDYYAAVLVKAYGQVGLRQWKDAVSTFDIYIRAYPTAADILIDRGNAKASLKDVAGAEKDFREALRFGPNDKEAKAGLKRIGAAK